MRKASSNEAIRAFNWALALQLIGGSPTLDAATSRRLHESLFDHGVFIERNLDFLRPGGRMAIVLPQGRFNNASDQRVREFIAERCDAPLSR